MSDDIFKVMSRPTDSEEKEESYKVKPPYGPFDYLNSINQHRNLFENAEDPTLIEKYYDPWLVNKGLSYFRDTVEFANIINQNYHIDNKLQYDFLINIVRPKDRRSKWFKKDQSSDLEVIKEVFGYSQRKAEIALSLLSAGQLNEIKTKIRKGGLKK